MRHNLSLEDNLDSSCFTFYSGGGPGKTGAGKWGQGAGGWGQETEDRGHGTKVRGQGIGDGTGHGTWDRGQVDIMGEAILCSYWLLAG